MTGTPAAGGDGDYRYYDDTALSLSDVTLALPRIVTFPPGEAGVMAKRVSMDFVFEIFRQFVVARQEPRNAQIDQMYRRVNQLDRDFQVRPCCWWWCWRWW